MHNKVILEANKNYNSFIRRQFMYLAPDIAPIKINTIVMMLPVARVEMPLRPCPILHPMATTAPNPIRSPPERLYLNC
jgi:hypothetical protein